MRAFDVIDAEQRSPAWLAARAGRVTGTAAKDLLATIKSGEAAARRDLRYRLVAERLTGQPSEDTYTNAAMERGILLEPVAIAAYEARASVLVAKSGFLAHRELPIGCSLDGDVSDFAGLVEVKCPKTATHVRYLREGRVPIDYLPQIRHNLFVTGAGWCDFVSFDDRLPERTQLFVVRITREQADLAGYEAALRTFLREVELEVEALKGWRVMEVA